VYYYYRNNKWKWDDVVTSMFISENDIWLLEHDDHLSLFTLNVAEQVEIPQRTYMDIMHS
jgi:hypothetical protein